jgi:hypothetical protein
MSQGHDCDKPLVIAIFQHLAVSIRLDAPPKLRTRDVIAQVSDVDSAQRVKWCYAVQCSELLADVVA